VLRFPSKFSGVLVLVGVLAAACAPAAATNPPATEPQSAVEPAQGVDTVPATVPAPTAVPAMQLEDFGPAPELTNTVWLNTPGNQPLRLADLRGKVVALEFWTFGCINCQHTMPSLKEWHDRYADQGLVIIGDHYPEFSFEADLGNLTDAVARYEILYAVAQDNDRRTWDAYDVHYWPTLMLIDKQGHIRYQHIGEGRYAETEAAIQTLLAE
jgi:thiol-disulfide isomerase/thioredoxin